MLSKETQDEIDKATRFGQGLEDLVANKGQFTVCCDRCPLLTAYWSLVFEYAKGILCLLRFEFYAPAFALWRPLLEAMVRECVSINGSEEDVEKIRKDWYKINFDKAGAQIEAALTASKIPTAGAFGNLFKSAQSTLHSFTHSGIQQLRSRFDGDDLGANYKSGATSSLVACSTVAVFVNTILVVNHFRLEHEQRQIFTLWNEFYSDAMTTASSTGP